MRKPLLWTIVCGMLTVFSWTVAQASEVVGGTAGTAGDSDSTTYHFDENNLDLVLSRPDGTPLTLNNVGYHYGTAYKIMNNGVDFVTGQGLKIEGADLIGTGWTTQGYPAAGTVAIDPLTGRFKFGRKWQAAIKLGELAVSYNHVASNDAGAAVIAFVNGIPATNLHVQDYSPSRGWFNDVIIDTNTNSTLAEVKIAMNDSGSRVMCLFRQDTTDYRLYANERLGGTWYGAVTIDAGQGQDVSEFDLDTTSAGNAFCAFKRSDGAENRAWANTYTVGSGWYGSVTVDANSNSPAANVRVVANDSSQAFCLFTQNDGSYRRAWASRYAPGIGWYTPVSISVNFSSNPGQLEADMDNAGQAIAVFTQSDGANTRLYAAHYAPGTGWQTPVILDQNNGYSIMFPTVAMNDAGQAVCVFYEISGPTFEIFAKRYVPGSGWQAAELLNPNLMVLSPMSLALDINDNGTILCLAQTGMPPEMDLTSFIYHANSGWQTPQTVSPERASVIPFYSLALNNAGEAFTSYFHITVFGMVSLYVNQFTSELSGGTTLVNYYSALATPTPFATAPSADVQGNRLEPLRGGTSTIRYYLDQAGVVSIKIYTLQGVLVKVVVQENQAAGEHSQTWGGANDLGHLVASGVYVVHIKTPSGNYTKKIVVIK